MADKSKENMSEWTDEQKKAWENFQGICYENGDRKGKQILFSEKEVNLLSILIRTAVFKQANVVASNFEEKKVEGMYPSDTIAYAVKGIYNSGVRDPFYYKLGLLALRDERVVAAVKKHQEILALL